MSAGVDDGAAMLADVENARQAIARRSLLAAADDLGRGLDHADQMAGAGSTIFPDDAAESGSGRAANSGRVSRFGAEVRLQSADVELLDNDVAGADRDLGVIEGGARRDRLPATWPLLRARESLDAAEVALAADQASDLPTQLAIAQQALRGYAGAAHRADAGALAAEIGVSLARPGGADRLTPARVAAWATKVGGWL